MECISNRYVTPFISWMGTSCFLYVNDPETMETIFNSPYCTNKGEFYRFMAEAIGDGLFTSSSPRWNKHRRLINPAFSRQIINNFLPIFNAEADVTLSKFPAIASSGTQLEMYELLKRNVLEAACLTTMGQRMNFEDKSSSHIFEAYKGVTEVCVRRMLSPWLYPDVLYRRSSLFVRQQHVVHVLFSFIESLLQLKNNKSIPKGINEQQQQQQHEEQHHLAMNENKIENSWKFANGKMSGDPLTNADAATSAAIRKSKSIFVEQVRSHVEQGQLSWEDVRAEANVIIAATFETTSTALYIVCLCLAMHPECQEKLYEELSALFPEKKPPDVNNEHLEKMTYTEMIINEALRLYSPVPMVLRSVADDFRLRNNILIPQGTQIGIDIYNMQRNEHIWGPNAKKFQPEEHFGPNAHKRHAFAFVPFTKGLRMCIGYRYALMLMKVFVAKIFRQYRIKTTATMDQLVVKGAISLKFAEYPLCQLEARTS
ncbi:probable cytochrome P450 313b1 isoform X2 [Eurosta solidaginis]